MSSMSQRTRSATKRARSPSSPSQYDRPSVCSQTIIILQPCQLFGLGKQKRISSVHDTSIPFPPFQPAGSRARGRSDDWVSQTQGLRLESPLLESSGCSTPVSHHGSEFEGRGDEAMVDEPMVCISVTYLCSSSSSSRPNHHRMQKTTQCPYHLQDLSLPYQNLQPRDFFVRQIHHTRHYRNCHTRIRLDCKYPPFRSKQQPHRPFRCTHTLP